MTNDKVRAVLERYEALLQADDFDADPRLQHLLTMIPTMRDMLRVIDGHLEYSASPLEDAIPVREKLMRWLGFMQGVLWTHDLYTIDELRRHNMPDGEPFRARESEDLT